MPTSLLLERHLDCNFSSFEEELISSHLPLFSSSHMSVASSYRSLTNGLLKRKASQPIKLDATELSKFVCRNHHWFRGESWKGVFSLLLGVNKEAYIINCHHKGNFLRRISQKIEETDAKYLDTSRLQTIPSTQLIYELPVTWGNKSPYCLSYNQVFHICAWKHPNQ